jgi:hypothetical protein
MKTPLVVLCSIIALSQIVRAGGNTSIVQVGRVSEITIEDQRIIIKGNAVIKRRVLSAEEKGDTSVFGQPAQWLHAKVENAVFEVVPYFTPGIEGVPTGSNNEEELKRLSEEWWKSIHTAAKEIKVGDSVTIGYQGDRTTILGYRVTKIVGYGSVSVKEK